MARNGNSGTFGNGRTGGRPKGVPNKVTTELKDMILQALSGAGGVEYLIQRAQDSPGPFLALVGKVLPLQVTGKDGKDFLPEGGVQFIFRVDPESKNRT
jgi:hypothetical protein